MAKARDGLELDQKINYFFINLFNYKQRQEYYLVRIAISIIHFLMFSLALFQLIAGSKYHPAISLLLVIGYGCSGFSLFSIGGVIFRWIAFAQNSILLVLASLGTVYFSIISPLNGGVFDTVGLVGCLIIGLIGGFTIKLLKKPTLKPSKENCEVEQG